MGNSNSGLKNDLWNLIGGNSFINKNYDLNQVILYPNPASDFIYVEYNRTDVLNYEFYNSTGSIISKGLLETGIETENLSDGIYFLKCFNGDDHFSKKFVVKH
jgi:hypothetical protein